MRDDGGTNGDGTARLTVQAAADYLGISTEAARQRVKRGTLPTERDSDGSVWVLLDTDKTGTNDRTNADHTRTDDRTNGDGTADQALLMAHLDSLQDQIGFLRRELERKDHIIMTLAQRVPELEAAQKPSEAAQGDSSHADDAGHHPEGNGAQRHSWWRRFFGLE